MTGNNLPLVSVLIPAYNHEKYIQECIESIIAQTYKNIELIVIDDGSSDSTWQKICEMREVCEKRFVKIIFETQKNQGTCFTLNKLIKYSNGNFISIIASDDKFLPNAIELLCNYLINHNDVGLVHGINLIMDENSIQCYWKKKKTTFKLENWQLHYIPGEKINVYSKKEANFTNFTEWIIKTNNIDINSKNYGSYEKLIQCNHISNGYLIRKSILDKIPPFTTEAPLEDYFLMLQISKIAKIRAIKNEIFYYRWHYKNTMSNMNKMCYMTFKTKLYEKKICNNLKDKKYKEMVLKSRYNIKIFFNIGFCKLYKIRKIFITRLMFQIFHIKITLIWKKL